MNINSLNKNFKNAYDWTGRLILPAENERRSDGGIFLEVLNAPESYDNLIGTKCRLACKKDTAYETYFNKSKTEIRFDNYTEESIKKMNVHPFRINGWKNISPLESLAGAHFKDDIIVAIHSPEFEDDSEHEKVLFISSEPVIISGNLYSLVKFSRKLNNNEYEVIHYNAEEKNFSGEKSVLIFSIPDALPGNKIPLTTLTDIEKTELNNDGFYVYCVLNNEKQIELKAIEPRKILSVGNEHEFATFKKSQKDLSSMLSTIKQKNVYLKKTFSLKQNENWKIGDRGFLIHIFGWRTGPNADVMKKGQRVEGHFSTGITEVIEDKITNDFKFDITYNQAYCHNKEGIISSPVKYHHYMGNLENGMMYQSPVADAIFKIHAKNIHVIDIFDKYIKKTLSRIRTGIGNGYTPVNAAINCSQDTAFAIYEASIREKKFFSRDDKKFITKFIRLYRGYTTIPKRWKKMLKNIPITQNDLVGKNIFLNAIFSIKSIFPLLHYKSIYRILSMHSSVITIIRTNSIGGLSDGVIPVMPTFKYEPDCDVK